MKTAKNNIICVFFFCLALNFALGQVMTFNSAPVAPSDLTVSGNFKSALDGNTDTVQNYIKNPKNSINSVDASGRTMLHYAAWMGQSEVVDLLLKNGAEVGTIDMFKRTPLALASETGKFEIVKKLIENGAEVKPKDAESPIVPAVIGGHLNIIELLLEKGADINAKPASGDSLIVAAGLSGNKAVVELLKQKGIPYTIYDAAAVNDIESLKAMLEKEPSLFDKPDAAGNTPLTIAAVKGSIDASKLLIEKGADVNSVNQWKTPVLYRAVISGSIEEVGLLLKNKAKIDIVDSQGMTPLAKSITLGNIEMIKYLLEKGANQDFELGDGNTPYMMAENSNREDIKGLFKQSSEKSGSKSVTTSFLEKGDKAPEFDAKTIDGKEIKIADYKGKIVLLYFWSTYFEKSQELLPELNANYDKYKDKGFEIIAISLDFSNDAVKSFADEKKLKWIQICRGEDANKKLERVFKVDKIPQYILLNAEGEVAAKDFSGKPLGDLIEGLLKK